MKGLPLRLFLLCLAAVGCAHNHYPADPFSGQAMPEEPMVVPGEPMAMPEDYSYQSSQEADAARFWTSYPAGSEVAAAQQAAGPALAAPRIDAPNVAAAPIRARAGPKPAAVTNEASVDRSHSVSNDRRAESTVKVTGMIEPAPGRAESPAAAADPPRLREPSATTVAQPENSLPATGAPSDLGYGKDASYRWISGTLDYVAMDGKWQIRYAPYSVENDRYGGSLFLQDDARLKNYQPGDVVVVEGDVVDTPTRMIPDNAEYRLRTIRRR